MLVDFGWVIFLRALFAIVSTMAAPAKDAAPSIADAFAATSTTLKVMPDTPGKEVTWSYTNHTDAPLAIERIDISCGCLSCLTQPAADIEADALAPFVCSACAGSNAIAFVSSRPSFGAHSSGRV